jgi:hypothetical protein
MVLEDIGEGAGTMNPLDLAGLTALMGCTAGRPEVVVGPGSRRRQATRRDP